jgi:hypothetical protein
MASRNRQDPKDRAARKNKALRARDKQVVWIHPTLWRHERNVTCVCGQWIPLSQAEAQEPQFVRDRTQGLAVLPRSTMIDALGRS